MKERPILFSAPMVRAILEGRKTMTRRVIEHEPHSACPYLTKNSVAAKSPFGKSGDRLYVRESARVINVRGDSLEIDIEYQADGLIKTVPYPARLAPAQKGKLLSNGTYREASRLWLEITNTRIERLKDINEADARAEGLSLITKDGSLYKYGIPDKDGLPGNDNDGWAWKEWESDHKNAFCKLWESIYGAGSWEANPFVWVIEFKKL